MKVNAKDQKRMADKARRIANFDNLTVIDHNALALAAQEPVKRLNDLRADNQDQLAAKLGEMAVAAMVAGRGDEAAALASNAFGKAQNAFRLRNPEPMMVEVHKFFLRRNGCKVADKPLVKHELMQRSN